MDSPKKNMIAWIQERLGLISGIILISLTVAIFLWGMRMRRIDQETMNARLGIIDSHAQIYTGKDHLSQGMPDYTDEQFRLGRIKKDDLFVARLYDVNKTRGRIDNEVLCPKDGELTGGNYKPQRISGVVAEAESSHRDTWRFTIPSWKGLSASHITGLAICDYSMIPDGLLIAFYVFDDTPVTFGEFETSPAPLYKVLHP